MEKNVKYSIVIPTYNHLEDSLKPCLESIKKYTDEDNVEIIIVANGCTDGTKDYADSTLGKSFEPIWLWFDEPLGYTKATNIGIYHSSGEYIIILNNDTVLLDQHKNQWLEMLEKPFIENKNVGITGPMKVFDKNFQKDFIIFFCAMTKKSIFYEVGILDEIFSPGFGEDIDWCIRLQNKGYDVVQVPYFSNTYNDEVKNKAAMIGGFPIYHVGEKTFDEDPTFQDIITRNIKILDDMYGNFNEKWLPYPFSKEQWNNRGIRLHLGCSMLYLNDFINVDIDNPIADVEADAANLSAFKDNTISLILASHLIEHFNKYDAIKALKEWYRVLKSGGWLVIEAPDIEKCFKLYLEYDDKEKKDEMLSCIYGLNIYGTFMAHLWGYTGKDICNLLKEVGFSYVEEKEPIQHLGSTHNLRVDARK